MKSRVWLYLGMLFATFAWGSGFVNVKYLLPYLEPFELVFVRYAMSAVIFLALLWSTQRATIASLLRQEWRLLALIGTFSIVICEGCVAVGQKMIPAGTGSLVIASSPVFVFVLSAIFIGERATWSRVLGVIVAFGGVFVIIRFASGGDISFRYLQGIAITLMAPIFGSIQTILSRRLVRTYSSLAVFGTACILGTIPLALTMTPAFFGRVAAMRWDGWLHLTYLAVTGTIVGRIVWGVGLRELGASRASAFSYLVPVWGVCTSCLILGEPFSMALVVGAAIVILGVVLVNRHD